MSAAEKVVELGPHTNMTPEQALAYSAREAWESVIVVGYHKDSDGLIVRSSAMTRQESLWLAEHLKLHAMDRL